MLGMFKVLLILTEWNQNMLYKALIEYMVYGIAA